MCMCVSFSAVNKWFVYYFRPQLIGLTTANGNTKEDNVYLNNQKILSLANRQDVSIYSVYVKLGFISNKLNFQ